MNRKTWPKVSIVVPCYYTEKDVSRCLDSILGQTYKNLEVICVNDGSGKKMSKILKQYEDLNPRVKVINNSDNLGLFRARCCGTGISTGDFILFVDSDSYIEIDLVRQLVFDALKHHSDLVIANVCNQRLDGRLTITNFNKEFLLDSSKEPDIFHKFIRSEGRFYRWHVIWGKLISRDIWEKALPYYQKVDRHLTMCEDVLFSTILLKLAKNIYLDDDAFYFYVDSGASSTTQEKPSPKNVINNIDDIIYSFKLTEQSLADLTDIKPYKDNLTNWRNSYLEKQLEVARHFSHDLYLQAKAAIRTKCRSYRRVDLDSFYASTAHLSRFNDDLIKIKAAIIESDIISFDIFDTLILRPFYYPTDLFQLLDPTAKKLLHSNGINRFSKLREIAERACREIAYKHDKEDITIDEIYQRLVSVHAVPQSVADKLKSLEIELERKFCTRRNFGYYLYELTKFLGKKIIITSDMYLPKEDIEYILKHNGYDSYADFYLSNEQNATKSSGKIFKLVLKREPDKNILHLDDNDHVCRKAREVGINVFQLTKATTALEQHTSGGIEHNFFGLSHDHAVFMRITGVRNSLALIANKLFDNPFCPYDPASDFNGSPYNLGYYALGMHLLALSNWLLVETKEKQLDSLGFMARDGYLPILTTEILQQHTNLNKNLKLTYAHVSRRTTLPLAVNDNYDFGAIRTYMDWYALTPSAALEELHSFITLPKDYQSRLKKAGYRLNRRFKTEREIIEFIELVRKNFYNHKKHQDFINMSREYLQKLYIGKSGVFDIGYSAKPELLISKLVNITDTYFIHANSSDAKENSDLSDIRLNTFYQHSPTFTGPLREVLISELSPSCISYARNEDHEVTPVFSDELDFDKYSEEAVAVIQRGALDFVGHYCDIFQGYFEIFNYDIYHMSIPFEFFMQYSKWSDRLMFKTMEFEANPNSILHVNDFWAKTIADYDHNFAKDRFTHLVDPTRIIPNRRSVRMLYYLLFNHTMFKQKFNEKTRAMQFHPRLRRRLLYYLLYNRRAIPYKIKLKLAKKPKR